MMTWFTRASLFDAALDMELPELTLAIREAHSLLNELLLGEHAPERGPAPTPLIRMWEGYEPALAAYTIACAATLVSYGVEETGIALDVSGTIQALRRNGDPAELVMPPWLSDIDFLRSHRSNMMRRWPDRYTWPRTPALMPYLWPIVDDDGGYVLKVSKYDRELMSKGERKLPADIQKRIEQ